ncbi:uncharacterized protein EMH_0099140 [Eimeria mitis]|uniref:Uncharacterized protein n=1 Tax=Eimeria mitis TaxID=44415 RepID=U6KH90_9EIME|nr:uncharacterized protein EMH_0099140 [Eimeria mitis]CDJ35637.1 hypothetical protein EMH_0099140 [Eimeria mitis]
MNAGLSYQGDRDSVCLSRWLCTALSALAETERDRERRQETEKEKEKEEKKETEKETEKEKKRKREEKKKKKKKRETKKLLSPLSCFSMKPRRRSTETPNASSYTNSNK